ncbi:long-chain fatty acid--CoA ligase [Sphingobium indicum]|uniref:Long-chain fatty acid--CoA ligase n=1 Tax=Sphingobium indicum TaxID=332055 RepID=A0A4Q4J659_9SPHN|nr:AMP-binding protein [Sphingobium indicum]NYI23634.1 long-chain acyl-CoA synthetase [Sphingobium indicum]RYM01518.1 long-chain fatty acid--CoA ligase [Sphingobium indicum]
MITPHGGQTSTSWPWLRIGAERRPVEDIRESGLKGAAALRSLGISSGDAVATLLKNDFPFIELSLAAQHIGAYLTPINWHNSAAEVEYILGNSQARLLLAHRDLLDALDICFPPGLAVVPCSPAGTDARQVRADGDMPEWSAWTAGFAPDPFPPAPPVGSMIYTSGTTGRPKAVRRAPPTPEEARANFTHYAHVYGAGPWLDRGEAITAMAPGPLYHAAPNAWSNFFLRCGASVVIETKFDAERLLATIEAERVTHLLVVPTMFALLLNLPQDVRDRYDMSSLRFVMHGAAPCAPHLKRAMIDWWGPVIFEHYGGTETGALTFCDSRQWLSHPGTVGRVLDDAQVAVLDATGAECPPGIPGQIYGRRALFPDFTYVGDEEKRRNAERDGLITLGDVGYLDEEGYLYLTGRSSDVIISGGVNIYPAEIEAEIMAIPGVIDCAVIGIPDDAFGESVAAIIQPEESAQLDPDELKGILRAKIAGYKVPRTFVFRSHLPREDSGKVFKGKLREPYWRDADRQI